MVLGGFPSWMLVVESVWAILEVVRVYLNRWTGCKTLADLVMSTNKGSEATEVYRSPGVLFLCTEAAAYL